MEFLTFTHYSNQTAIPVGKDVQLYLFAQRQLQVSKLHHCQKKMKIICRRLNRG